MGEVRAIAPDGVDAAVHLIGDPGQDIQPRSCEDGGTLLRPSFSFHPIWFPGAGADHRRADRRVSRRVTALRKLASLIEKGRLRVVIDREHPFSEVERALGESGTRPSET